MVRTISFSNQNFRVFRVNGKRPWRHVYLDPEPRYLDSGAPAKYLWDPTFSMAVARLSSMSIPHTVEPVSAL